MERIIIDVNALINDMCEGNIGAFTFLNSLAMQKYPEGIRAILFMEELEIRGEKAYKLWKDCCNCNYNKVFQTLQAFRDGKFTSDQIHENLNQNNAKPFI